MSLRIRSIEFNRFKALSEFTAALGSMNILVGPNNSGKSTLLSAFRVLAQASRVARSRRPERVATPAGVRTGYRIGEETLPVSLENVHTDYEDSDSSIVFTLSNSSRMTLWFPTEGGCLFVPEQSGALVSSPAVFKNLFPFSLAVVPVLGPVEHRERRLERSTVLAGLSTHRASRHFRNYWYHFPDGFEAFANWIRESWPGMDITPPEPSGEYQDELAMFCSEDRIARELYWAGFGFQVWCQLLTHVHRSSSSSVLIVDEPETYLHPEVQRRLINLLRDLGPDIVIATHSTEILGEADPSEILLIDKHRARAQRLREIAEVQKAVDSLGSVHNISLASLAQKRRVVFVEGKKDFVLITRFARKLGFHRLASGADVTPIESGGFGSWSRVRELARSIEDVLGAGLEICAVYDRDYYCDEELDQVQDSLDDSLSFAHIHKRKEIENYLLVPAVLDRALQRAIEARARRLGESPPRAESVVELLEELTDDRREKVTAELVAKKQNYLRPSGQDPAELARQAISSFTREWDSLDKRLSLVPGKVILNELRTKVQKMYSVTLTDAKIVDAFHQGEIPEDLLSLVVRLNEFSSGQSS